MKFRYMNESMMGDLNKGKKLRTSIKNTQGKYILLYSKEISILQTHILTHSLSQDPSSSTCSTAFYTLFCLSLWNLL